MNFNTCIDLCNYHQKSDYGTVPSQKTPLMLPLNVQFLLGGKESKVKSSENKE